MPPPAPVLGRLACLVLGCLLLAGCTWFGSDRAPSAEVPAVPDQSAAAAGSWATGLRMGPNGPIPVIVVDQFGYLPGATKVAVLRQPVTGYDAGSPYEPSRQIRLLDADTGSVVLQAPATPWRAGSVDAASGDRAWSFDFSEVTQPGRYVVEDPVAQVRSPQFAVAEDVYDDVLRAAVRAFLYQRAGQEKTAESVGQAWADGASHLGPRQDSEAVAWQQQDDPSTRRDLRGGWYDAGDFNKYTAWHAGYLLTLLRTYAEHPTLVGDDYDIPESGNGVSDLLDEIAWGVDWLARMQLDDGSVLCVAGLASGSPPSTATGPSFYGPPTTNASLRAASAFAYAASVFADSGVPALAARAAELTSRARAAWSWAQANPAVVYYNNDDTMTPGSHGLAAGQQETDDAGRARSRVQAAVHLFAVTGERSFRQVVDSGYPALVPGGAPTQWTGAEQETLLTYASLPGATEAVADRIRSDYEKALRSSPLLLPAVADQRDPYRAPISEYTWGSNQSKAAVGRLLALGHAYGLAGPEADTGFAAAADYVHYLHGVNPLGLVYLTTMSGAGAEHSVSTLYHWWFANGTPWDAVTTTTPGPAPGLLVGGPNPQYQIDACCARTPACGWAQEASACDLDLTPPLGQPAMKSYLQFNDGWPANSWEVTENSNGYQVQYLRLLASVMDP